MEGPREHRVGLQGVWGGAWELGWGLSIHSRSAAVHGSRPEEVIDHRLTEREWAEEWKHLNNVSVQDKAWVPQLLQGLCPTCEAVGTGLGWTPSDSVPSWEAHSGALGSRGKALGRTRSGTMGVGEHLSRPTLDFQSAM